MATYREIEQQELSRVVGPFGGQYYLAEYPREVVEPRVRQWFVRELEQYVKDGVPPQNVPYLVRRCAREFGLFDHNGGILGDVVEIMFSVWDGLNQE